MSSAMPQHDQDDDDVADGEKVARVRAELPVTARYVYMNAGTNGPLPIACHAAMMEWAERDLTAGRILLTSLPDMLAAWKDTRVAVADLLGCDAEEVALTHSTTEAINTALMGMMWRAGDEIVTAATEHAGGLFPAYQVHQRFGVNVHMTNIGSPTVDPVSALKAVLGPRTRAVALSHVSWSTGMTLPLRELVDLTHEAGALFICDAAQSCGMIPSNVRELDVDVYALSGQKWLCGPDGTGALYIRRDRLNAIPPPFMGYFTGRREASDPVGSYALSEGGVRYEATTLNPATAVGFTASLRWLEREVGWQWAFARIARLARLCHSQLSAIPNVTVHTPAETMAGLVHFTISGVRSSSIVRRLAEDNILIRRVPDNDYARASIGFYNTEEEITRLADHIAALAGSPT